MSEEEFFNRIVRIIGGNRMKVTIYELLGMVKDGKELPKLEDEVEKDFAYYVYDKWGDTCNLEDLKNILNDEVEIIEPQEHKIPEKLIHCYTDKLTKEFVIKCFDDVSDKINEILDYLEANND